VAASSSPQVTPNDCAIRDDRFPSKDDVLWSSDDRFARYLVSRILKIPSRTTKSNKAQHMFQVDESKIVVYVEINTHGLNVFVAGVMDWLLHSWETVSLAAIAISEASLVNTVSRNGRRYLWQDVRKEGRPTSRAACES